MSKNNVKNNIIQFSNINSEPASIKNQRINAYKQLDSFGHPSFGPEIKLDFEIGTYLENAPHHFHMCNDGFIACDIHTAFNKYKSLIEKYYGKLISTDENRYTVLNSTAFESGYFIYVFENQTLSFPIFNKNINCNLTRNIIIVDSNAELNFIDYCNNDSIFRCDCTEIFVEKNAVCKYLNISKNNNMVVSIKRAQVNENARMDWINIIEGANIYMGYPTSILMGSKSASSSSTFASSKKGNSINVGSKMIHEAPNTISKVSNISNIDSNSEIELRNLIYIKNNAVSSKSKVEYIYGINGSKAKYDSVPRYILDNSKSNINYTIRNNDKISIDIIDLIESSFMKLSRKNKKILRNLLKKGK